VTEGNGHVIDPNGDARRALQEAVAEHGPEVLSNAGVMENVCRDHLAGLPGESILIGDAARTNVPALLGDLIPQLGNYGAIQSAAAALAGEHSLDMAASLWVVREFARALGYIAPATGTAAAFPGSGPRPVPGSGPRPVPSSGPRPVPSSGPRPVSGSGSPPDAGPAERPLGTGGATGAAEGSGTAGAGSEESENVRPGGGEAGRAVAGGAAAGAAAAAAAGTAGVAADEAGRGEGADGAAAASGPGASEAVDSGTAGSGAAGTSGARVGGTSASGSEPGHGTGSASGGTGSASGSPGNTGPGTMGTADGGTGAAGPAAGGPGATGPAVGGPGTTGLAAGGAAVTGPVGGSGPVSTGPMRDVSGASGPAAGGAWGGPSAPGGTAGSGTGDGGTGGAGGAGGVGGLGGGTGGAAPEGEPGFPLPLPAGRLPGRQSQRSKLLNRNTVGIAAAIALIAGYLGVAAAAHLSPFPAKAVPTVSASQSSSPPASTNSSPASSPDPSADPSPTSQLDILLTKIPTGVRRAGKCLNAGTGSGATAVIQCQKLQGLGANVIVYYLYPNKTALASGLSSFLKAATFSKRRECTTNGGFRDFIVDCESAFVIKTPGMTGSIAEYVNKTASQNPIIVSTDNEQNVMAVLVGINDGDLLAYWNKFEWVVTP
jgi:hypothetical protein